MYKSNQNTKENIQNKNMNQVDLKSIISKHIKVIKTIIAANQHTM